MVASRLPFKNTSSTMTGAPEPWTEPRATGLVVLADGTVIEGQGCGATGAKEAEVCFNTAITGYQEILTDPSYAGQIVTFTFPHVGNVGTNEDDVETVPLDPKERVVGAIMKAPVTPASSYRSTTELDEWLKLLGIIGVAGVDTRALTALIREKGLANAVIAHDPEGRFDREGLKRRAREWAGLAGADLVPGVGASENAEWRERSWTLEGGYARAEGDGAYHVVAIDYGSKRNILRLFADLDCRITIVPATTSAHDIIALKPDGVFLSNGPGDPAATGEYAVPTIRALIEANLPVFGICLGHQLLALALGARTVKMHQGHHGANHPVRDDTTGKVEIVSMNHGFAVDRETLPDDVAETHVSLFDGSNCGIALKEKPVFGVQHHPEASPGPQDSHYLFRRFVNLMRERRGEEPLPERGELAA